MLRAAHFWNNLWNMHCHQHISSYCWPQMLTEVTRLGCRLDTWHDVCPDDSDSPRQTAMEELAQHVVSMPVLNATRPCQMPSDL